MFGFGDLSDTHSALPDKGFHTAQDILHRISAPALQGAFPDHKRSPPVSSQRGQRMPVPFDIAVDLGPPVRGAGLGPPEE